MCIYMYVFVFMYSYIYIHLYLYRYVYIYMLVALSQSVPCPPSRRPHAQWRCRSPPSAPRRAHQCFSPSLLVPRRVIPPQSGPIRAPGQEEQVMGLVRGMEVGRGWRRCGGCWRSTRCLPK